MERLSKAAGTEGSAEQQSGASKKIKQELRKKLGLDLPIFYLSIGNMASTDTLYKVQDRYHKSNLEALTHQCGNWQAVSDYYHSLLAFQKLHESFKVEDILATERGLSKNKINEALNQSSFEVGSLLETYKVEVLDVKFEKLENMYATNSFLNPFDKQFQILLFLSLHQHLSSAIDLLYLLYGHILYI